MTEQRQLIDSYFAAMRRGAEAEEEMMSLFAEDAVYVEPFSGDTEPAVGKEAVRSRLRIGWQAPLPDLELNVLEIEVDGVTARTRWECRSPGLPGPVRGEDHYEIRDGKISRLEVRLLD
ncbi:MAG: nuclear transport factor 2 family protein [Acidimicrobiia bacterium]|nr:nuclear transport factor 2 family protein [Acidimicrobiia bacterium]